MATKIIHKKSSVASSVPSAGDLEPGEIAVNLADQKIYSKTTGGTVIELAPGFTSTVDAHLNYSTASSGQVLSYNGSDYDWVTLAGGTENLVNVTTSGSTSTLDLDAGVFFRIEDVSVNRTVALSNIPSSGVFSAIIEIPYQSGTITWPSEFSWEGESAPTLTANKDYLVEIHRSETDTTVLKAIPYGPFAGTADITFPTFVGSATGSSQGNTDTTVSLTSLSGGSASAPVEDDIVVVCAGVSDNNSGAQPTLSGYTLAAEGTISDSQQSGLAVFYKVMTGTPDTSITVTGNANGTDAQAVAVLVFKGVDTSTPLDVTSTVTLTTNTVLADPPSITSSSSNKGAILLGIGAGGHNDGVQTFSDSASEYDGFVTLGHDDNNDITVGAGFTTVTANGDTFNLSAFGYSNGDSTAYSNVAASVILRGAV
jgi:hypothetical protein